MAAKAVASLPHINRATADRILKKKEGAKVPRRRDRKSYEEANLPKAVPFNALV